MSRLTPILHSAALAVLPLAAVAAETPVPTGPIVELPKFEVTDSRILPQPERWHYAAIPGFEVLANISERETKRFVNDFLLLQVAVDVLMPGMNRGNLAVPTSLILCGRGNGFNRFLPADRGDDTYRTNSLFFDDPERGAIVVDFALSELQLTDNTTMEADPYRGFYKEYFRHLIRQQMGRRSPAWFEEGMVQMFSAIDFNKKWVTFAQIGDGFGGGKDNDFNRIFTRTDENGNAYSHALMALPEMFARETVMTDTFWSAQCYAFVHMCLYGRGQRYQAGFVRFLSRLATEPLSEELFVDCFKRSYKDMGIELRGYLDFTDHKYIQYTAKKGQALPDPPAFTLRDATEAEAGRITGETLRLAKRGNEAHLALIAPYIRGSRDPQLLGALGLDERAAGHDERAKRFLDAAAQAKVVRPRVYLELARLNYAAARAAPAANEGALSAAQVAGVLEPLQVARAQPPPMAEVYELLAELWTLRMPPTRDDVAVLNQGLSYFPRRVGLLLRTAELNLRYGDPEIARKIVNYGLRVATDPGVRQAFDQLREKLPPPPPAPPPSSAPKTITPGAGSTSPARR